MDESVYLKENIRWSCRADTLSIFLLKVKLFSVKDPKLLSKRKTFYYYDYCY